MTHKRMMYSLNPCEIDTNECLLPKSIQSSHESLKWFALTFVALSILGPNYAFGAKTVLQTHIEALFNIDDAQYNLLFTLGGSPTIFTPIFGGYLADYFGAKTTLIFTLVIVIVSQIILYIACTLKDYNIFALGGCVCSVMFDTFYLSRMKLICSMFYDKNMSLALGAAVILQKLVLLVSSVLTPWVYDQTQSVAKTFLLPVGAAVISLVSGLVFVWLDTRYELSASKGNPAASSITSEGKYKVKLTDFKKFSKVLWLFIFTLGSCFCGYSCLLVNLNALLERKYGFSVQAAGNLATIYTISSIITTFLLSIFLNRFHKRLYSLLFSVMSINLVYVSFLLLPDCNQCYVSIFPLICFGTFSGSCFLLSSIVPSFLVPKELLGTAMGVMGVVLNCSSVALPFFFGLLLDETKSGNTFDYTWALVMLLAFSLIGSIFFCFMNYFDLQWGRRIDKKMPEENKDIWEKF